jgi:signal transduction histidine kinase
MTRGVALGASGAAWAWFGVAAAVLLAVVSGLTVVLVRLDRDEVVAREQAWVHERLRLGLWRMDSWLSPLLAREAMRPVGDYRSFPSAPTAWTRGLARLSPGDVVVNSPLLGVESGPFSLHFELGTNGVTSPQVPLGNERDVCEANGIDRAVLDRAAARLEGLLPRLQREGIDRRLGGAEAKLGLMGCNPIAAETQDQARQSVQEYSNRQLTVVQNLFEQQSVSNAWTANFVGAGAAALDRVGPLVPIWLEGATPLLLFVRRATIAGAPCVQGIVVDWDRLQADLLALVRDLFGDAAHLVRCEQPTPAEQPSMLASVPVRLVADCRTETLRGLPLPWILGVTWGITLLGLCGLGFTLRTAIGYGERRARFASAVTHELRTPLTTFRMYSEMLAEGIVQDPAAQREYLLTLQRESDRLARVVENVLAWSRLEDGRFTHRRSEHGVGALVARIEPPLRRRLGEAALELVVAIDPAVAAATIATDEDAVGQILFNLVDNAAKYAAAASDRRVELHVAWRGERLSFLLRDHGPGVPPALHERIFAPFDRGLVAAGSNDVPGVGLGLALARGLARDLGGDLCLRPEAEGGACFELTLPAA